MTKPLAEAKNVELRVEATAQTALLLLDRLRIKRVFINLLTNAIEASPEGQTVKIRYCMRGGDLVVEVADRGPGIALEIRKDIFLPFFTTRKRGPASAFRLSKRSSKRTKGSLEVLDNLNGATFRVRLPV